MYYPLTIRYPSGEVVTYAYDREGENRLWAGASLLVDKVTYNGRGQMVRLRRGNTLETLFSYYGQTGTAGNSNYRLQELRYGSTTDALPDFTYSYDPVGNVKSLVAKRVSGSTYTDSQSFSYDQLNRLTSASATGGLANYATSMTYNAIGNLTGIWGVSFGYQDTAHVHALTHLGSNQQYWYDANGNMTRMDSAGVTQTHNFDIENRLTSVQVGSSTTTFAYDAAGQRVKTQQPNGVKTYYPFPGYEEEVNGSTTTRRTTYSLAGQAIAVRVQVVGGSNAFYYLHTDHLGSTTALSNSGVGGGLVSGSTARYYPFGAWRTTPTQTLTDRGYTSHLENMELGLIYMNARYYVPAIGRFASPDTIVPEPGQPQSFNRYAYTLNNPLRYTDPSGHRACEGTNNCRPPAPSPTPAAATPVVTFTGESFTPSEQTTIESAIVQLGSQYAFHLNHRNRELWKFGALPSFRSIRAREEFLLVHGGPVLFVGTYTTPSGFLGERTGRGEISVNLTFRTGISEMWTLHELGHDFNGQAGGRPYTDLANEGLYVGEEQFAGHTDTGYLRTFNGFKSDRPPDVQNWQYYTVNEDFADTFANWAARNFASDVYGQTRQNWVANHMDHWVSLAVAQNQ